MFLSTLIKVIRNNRWFYIPYALLFILGAMIQLCFTQYDITLAINGFHHAALDLLFSYTTILGDGLFAAAVVLLIFIFLRHEGWRALLVWAVPSLFTQLMKRQFFADHLRPGVLMKDVADLHYVEGIFMNELNSFPSGHSTTAFALFCYLSLLTKNKKLGLLFLFIALLTGISRIYLLQHFFEDVLSGSFIGVSFATLIFVLFPHRSRKKAASVHSPA